MTSERESSLSIHQEPSTHGEELATNEEIKEEAISAPETKTEAEDVDTIIYDEPTVELTDMDTDIENEKQNLSAIDSQPLFEQPTVVEGKRSRKPTTRLEISQSTPSKKELSIPQGHGKPLGEIEYINYQITHASTDALSRMRSICFGRRGNKATIRKNLREFKGFDFVQDGDDYKKHLKNLIKLKKDQLRSISNILGVSSTGRNTDHAERILNFLVKPVDEGKRAPGKKTSVRTSKKRSSDSKESLDINQNKKVKHESDYVYKPGKKSVNKHSTDSTDAKRTEGTLNESNSNTYEKTVNVKTSISEITDDKPIKNEALVNSSVPDGI